MAHMATTGCRSITTTRGIPTTATTRTTATIGIKTTATSGTMVATDGPAMVSAEKLDDELLCQ